MATHHELDLARLVQAWEAREDYDSSWLSQPWDEADDTASNDVGNGWACRIGRVVLVEQSDGQRRSISYDRELEARLDWRTFEEAYGD
jgi:hypothetical protein